jgi:hypothetical protein
VQKLSSSTFLRNLLLGISLIFSIRKLRAVGTKSTGNGRTNRDKAVSNTAYLPAIGD